MNPFRRLRQPPTVDTGGPWLDTLPSLPALDSGPGRSGLPGPAFGPLPATAQLEGVDVHELESQTVFDQFFGEPVADRR